MFGYHQRRGGHTRVLQYHCDKTLLPIHQTIFFLYLFTLLYLTVLQQLCQLNTFAYDIIDVGFNLFRWKGKRIEEKNEKDVC